MIFVESGRLMNLLAFENTKGNGFLLYSAHLFVPLVLRTLGTHVRKTKRIFWISFAFHSLIRTFDLNGPRYLRSKIQKETNFFCILLTYSYLWFYEP